MKSSDQKEGSVDKKKYVFFSDPDVIAKRAETSAVAAQITRELETQQKTFEKQSVALRVPPIGIKSLENLLSYYPVQPYPFTFISAVKKKLALEDIDIGTKAHDSNSQTKNSLTSSVLKATSTQSLNTQNQIIQKMDFIKPLKVPDLKISPKTLDFSSRENSVSKELPLTKSEIAAKEFAHDRSDKGLRTGERVQRKLDFSSDGSSFINCESIELLKVPNVSIASNLSKKKEHVRDSSREKENRSKRMKKDDFSSTKRDESAQDQVKRSRSPRRVSRKDANDMGNVKLPKNERSFHAAKSNDFSSIKSKDKNSVASIATKDDKRQRSFNAQSVELTKDDSLESKIRISSNEPPIFSSWKMLDKVTLRDNIGILSSTENKSVSHYFLKQKSEVEDLKHKSDLDSRQSKDKLNTIYKEQTKRVSKNKVLNNKGEDKLCSINSESSEDLEFITETNSSRSHISTYPISFTQSSKNKDLETAMEKQNINSARSAKVSENFKYTEHSVAGSASTSIKKDEKSCSQSIITTKETTTNDDSNDVNDGTLPEALFDSRRISLRDGYSQPEFHNLMTPEKMNLVLRSKRRRYLMQSSDSDVDARCSKYKPTVKSEKEQEEVQLIHPTALHMQFQAELHLYDTYNESLRQVMDVEKSLYNTKYEMQEQKNSQKVTDEKNEEKVMQIVEDCTADNDAIEKTTWNPVLYKKDAVEPRKSSDEAHFSREHYIPNESNVDQVGYGFNYGKFNKAVIKMAEEQTRTMNDIATQTDMSADKRNAQNKLSEIRENTYGSFLRENDIPQLSLDSAEQFEDLDQIEEISLPSRIRTMSEISLHETTSSIKTETGTEISISTRGVTCSFNQYIGSEIARLLRDENQRSYQIEELFKFQEKTLNDKTKKLAQLEEQKRVLKDTGQDSRSVKKKQRALLLKLQQEKEEIQSLKELYEITSQERKRMLQKQKDMFNLQMSTKNILTKLKRTADSQSPRRLSGPMKGYDIRSNSSMSSLIDSDKSQHDRSQIDTRLQACESDASKLDWLKSNILSLVEENNTSRLEDLAENKEQEKNPMQLQKKSDMSKYELRSRKYEEKMPRADVLRQKQNQLNMESKRIQGHPMKINIRLLENQDQIRLSQSRPEDASVHDYVKSESDTLVEELSKKSRTSLMEVLSKRSGTSQLTDPSIQAVTTAKENELTSNAVTANSESIEEEIVQDTISKTTQLQISETSQTSMNKNSKKIDKSITSDRDISKKLQPNSAELKTSSKRKNSKYQKTKSSSSISTEDVLRSKSSSHILEELIKHHDKRTKVENELLQSDNEKESSILSELDLNKSQTSIQMVVKHPSKTTKDKSLKSSSEISNESKENGSAPISNRKFESDQSLSRNERDTQNAFMSQINTFAVSHSSEESEKNLSRSIVVRSQDRKFEQILNARETALASRKNCVEEWMAWHARLRAEEDRVTRMEQAAFKLVAAASNVLCQQGGDTTVSSDTSDVEGRIGLLTEKLAERRLEMARLKREAKKQAKKQLRALEANLLNQIKKYDTTIHEMRKKLDSKKAIKETDKLAIEPKSLADFKVPEISLKKIQDIYKSSDLLRSRSESDLLLTRNQQNLLKVVTPIVHDDKHEKDNSQSSIRSPNIKDANVYTLKSITDSNCSPVRTVFGDYTESTETYDKIQTVPSASSISNDAHSGKHVPSMERQIGESITADIKQTNVSHDAESIRTDPSTVQSELEVRMMSDGRFEDHNTINTESVEDRVITNVDQSHPKTLTILSEIPEIKTVEHSQSIPSKSECSTKNVACVTDSSILTYSRKLDFLQLNNKNLSEDISSIEKDIKALSEIMSRLSNESNDKSRTDNDERNTSQDISEIISKSVFSDRTIDNEEQQAISPVKEIDQSESSFMSINNRKSTASNDSSHDKYISDRISSEISAIIPEGAPTISNLSHEIDYEAKSREIMNEIEKSVLSQHTKVASDNQISVLKSGNEELLNDLVSELDIKSISEILSKVSESRKSLDLAKDTATQITDDSKKGTNEQSDSNKAILEKDFVRSQTKETYSRKFFEHFSTTPVQSPIIAGHRSKDTILQDNSSTVPSLAPSQNLHVFADKDLKSSRNIPEAEARIDNTANDVRISEEDILDEDIHTEVLDSTVNSKGPASRTDQNQLRTIAENISQDKDDWTTSDSFEVPQDEISTGVREEFENSKSGLDDTSNHFSEKDVSRVDDMTNQETEGNLTNDVSAFLPKGESTHIAVQDVKDTSARSHMVKSNDELDDILDIIARENDKEKGSSENGKLDNVISDSMAELLDRVKDIVENEGKSIDSSFKGFLCNIDSIDQIETVSDALMLSNKTQNEINEKDITVEINAVNISKDNESSNCEEVMDTSLRIVDDKSAMNANLYVEIEENPREAMSEVQEIIITELDSSSAEDNMLSELEIDAKVELPEEEESAKCNINEDENKCMAERNAGAAMPIEIKECLESIMEQDSSDGEQLDNLVEVAVSGLDTVEKTVPSSRDSLKPVIDDAVSTRTGRVEKETTDDTAEKNNDEATISNASVAQNINKTFDILKDPEYEDISEESLEVSEILDKDDFPKAGTAKKPANLPERYQTTQKSEDILRILDEISQKSSFDSVSNSQNERNAQSVTSATEEIGKALGAEISAEDNGSSSKMNRTTNKFEEESYEVNETKSRFLEEAKLQDRQSVETNDADSLSERKVIPLRLDEDEKSSQIIYELRERVSQLQEQNGSSESSEAGDTPRGVSEIDMDSPRDFNDSRLDIDILDDDLLSGTKATNRNIDMETNFHSASIVTSDKDIEAMIYELKASLGKPGQDLAELEAKLLRIEQLQIELEIKKLEAEEVSYYVREIPNKPPPPYTPPGDGRLSASLGSPSLVTAVIPSNVEELTSFTERATTLIYNAKLAGEDIASLEAPSEIYELTKDKSEKRDRRIYNTFLFDLCKETIVEVYRAEYEKPGPSWTKPNVKIKPTMKIPKNVEELIEYVNKEVATLFGFKTKLQRENMVMRWSRKRRDRVDELLAREAQAEEDEWTKFHHDELAVKNGLTVAILDTLVMETVNVMKIAYSKKRRIMV